MFRTLALLVAFTALPALAVPSTASADEIVRYQLKDWKAKHIHDTKKSETIAKTLKKLKCEVKTEQHNGHIDLKYRCVKWQALKLESHDDAHKWEKWLKEFGFTTEHKH